LTKDNLLTKNFEKFIQNNQNIFDKNIIALGISGGPDSLALAIIANKFKIKYNYKLIAFTVNHQIRKESKKEAVFVKNIMHQLGIEHHTLLWTEIKPITKLQESARIARYNLLGKACNKYQCKYILLAHHADDQVETLIIRLEANSGIDGLACMQENTKILTSSGTINLIRPFLNNRKKELIKICEINKLNWVKDPSNINMKYSRSKIRKLLVKSNVYSDFNDSILLFSRLKFRLDKIIFDYMKNSIEFGDIGICKLSLYKFKKLPFVFQKKLLNKLIQLIGGKKYPRKSIIITRLTENLINENTKNTTVGGVYIQYNNKFIIMSRQLDNSIKINKIVNLSTLWDRRFIINNKTKELNITIGPLGEKDYLLMIKLNKIKKPSIHFNAIKTLPTIRLLEEIVSVPHLLYWKSNFWKKNINITHVENDLFKKYSNINIY